MKNGTQGLARSAARALTSVELCDADVELLPELGNLAASLEQEQEGFPHDLDQASVSPRVELPRGELR